jgi:alkanesulfonate monooxygenase SsuD/methylene tetrahydromethanopterin reductase-like flavin-dependent oxidoreductase (luciferase family)
MAGTRAGWRWSWWETSPSPTARQDLTDRRFVGTLDQIMDNVRTAADAGADELIVDLNLQDWFISTQQMLETAVEIRERAAAS